jgi:uncharacterized cupin superfamily protein
MKKAQLSSLPEQEGTSPHGRYRIFRRSISEALGGQKDKGVWGGGHPFDVEWVRLPAGKTNFPFHAHYGQWEMYMFISGHGEMRGPAETISVEAGDSVIFPPGEAHQITNNSDADLIYYVIADHPCADIAFYPDTEKWAIKPPRKFFKMTEVPYYEPTD